MGYATGHRLWRSSRAKIQLAVSQLGNKKGGDAHVAAERRANEENKQEGEEEQTVVELRMPRSSDFE